MRRTQFIARLAMTQVQATGPPYDAFISYSHKKERWLVKRLQQQLTTLGKAWWQRRVLRVFRDEASQGATSELWPNLERALSRSRFLIVCASPEAAESRWVDKEISFWLDQHRPANLLIALMAGELQWDDDANDFEWSCDTPLPPSLKAIFKTEPKWVDFRPYHSPDKEPTADGAFLGLVADLQAAIRGVPKEDILSEELTQQRRARLLAYSAAVILAILATLAIAAAGIARRNQQIALRNDSISLTALSNTARDEGHPVDAIRLALAAWPRQGDDGRPELRVTINRIVHALSVVQERVRFTRHNAPVRAAAFSPDGRRAITASDDKKVLVWDAATGEVVQPINVPAAVKSAAFNQDGSRVVTASDDEIARIYNVDTGDPVEIRVHGLESAAFSPDGSRIVTASDDKTARIWDITSGKEVATLNGHTGKVHSANFSPDGLRIVTASKDHTGRIWDISKPSHYKKLKGRLLKGHTDEVYSAAFSRDSKRIVTASEDHTAIIWDARTRAVNSRLDTKGNDAIHSAVFDRAGSRVATGSYDYTARIWDVRTKRARVLKVLRGHDDVVNSVSFSPDGSQLISGADDNTARIWNANTDEDFTKLKGHDDYVSSVMFNFDGSRVVTASRDQSAWDAGTGMPLGKLSDEHDDAVNFAAFSPNGSQVVTASLDKTFKIWDAHSFKVVRPFPAQGSEIYSAVFSPDGALILTASADKFVKAWNAKTGVEAFRFRHPAEVRFAEFNRDGSNVVTAGADNLVRIWDIKNQIESKTPFKHTGIVYSASFSPDGSRIVSASADKTLAYGISALKKQSFSGTRIKFTLQHSVATANE